MCLPFFANMWPNESSFSCSSFRIVATAANPDDAAEFEMRDGPHTQLELRGGDVISWRFRAGSYYCQKHVVELTVNGTKVGLDTPGVELYYARAFTTDWYEPKFTPVFGEDEDEQDLQKFLPLRTRKFDGTPISPTGDYFEPLDASDADHKPSNFYYRMTLPVRFICLTFLPGLHCNDCKSG